MGWRGQGKAVAEMVAACLACGWLPVGRARFAGAVLAARHLVRGCAGADGLRCLVPAEFRTGASGVFVSPAAEGKVPAVAGVQIRLG